MRSAKKSKSVSLMLILMFGLGTVMNSIVFCLTEFLVAPTSQSVSIGETATFRCQHESAHVLYWRVNGLPIGSTPPPGVSRSTSVDGNNIIHVLTISGIPEYNGTVVECVAGFVNGSSEVSAAVFLEVLFGYITTDPYHNGFTLSPSSTIAAVGTTATFMCQHSTADSIGWRLNGTSLALLRPKLVTTSGVAGIHTLMIDAIANYNDTIVQCVAIFFDDSMPEISTAVRLLIQGPLEAIAFVHVTNSSSAISLSWHHPFSLNLSNVEPDIVYCVDVHRITCGVKQQIICDCEVFQSVYKFAVSSPDPRDIYQFIITPRNNLIGAMNGTSSKPVTGKFTNDVTVETQLDYVAELNVQVLISKWVPCDIGIYSVSFWSIDGLERLENLNCSTAATIGRIDIQLRLKCELERRRVCQCHLFYYVPQGDGISNVSVARNFELSTHDVQNIQVSAVSDKIHLNYTYVDGSTAKGILVIIHSGGLFHYLIMNRNTEHIPTEIDGLSAGRYYLSMFVITEEGIPLNRSASHPRVVELQRNSAKSCQGSPLTVTATIVRDKNPLELSVQCVFSDINYTACVVVIHPVTTHDLKEYHLVGVKIHYVLRYGAKASLNITLDNIGDNVAVFAYNGTKNMIDDGPVIVLSGTNCSEVNSDPDSNSVHILIILYIGIIVVLGITCIYVMYVVLTIKHRKRKHNKVKMVQGKHNDLRPQSNTGSSELSPYYTNLEQITTTCVQEESPQLSAIEAESNLLCISKGFTPTPTVHTKQFPRSSLTREYDVPSYCKAGNTNYNNSKIMQSELCSFPELCSGIETSVCDEYPNKQPVICSDAPSSLLSSSKFLENTYSMCSDDLSEKPDKSKGGLLIPFRRNEDPLRCLPITTLHYTLSPGICIYMDREFEPEYHTLLVPRIFTYLVDSENALPRVKRCSWLASLGCCPAYTPASGNKIIGRYHFGRHDDLERQDLSVVAYKDKLEQPEALSKMR